MQKALSSNDAQFWDYLVMAAHSLVNVAPSGGPDQGGRGGIGLTQA